MTIREILCDYLAHGREAQPVFLTASASMAKSSPLVNSLAGSAVVLDLDVLDLEVLDLDVLDLDVLNLDAFGLDTTVSIDIAQAAASFGFRVGTETIFGLAVGGL
jgi:hypothetical protein